MKTIARRAQLHLTCQESTRLALDVLEELKIERCCTETAEGAQA